jgi:hypothetical protein
MNAKWEGRLLGREDQIGVGYIGFEVGGGGCNLVRHEEGWLGPKKRKPSHGGLVLASKMQVGWFLGRGDPTRVGDIVLEVEGRCDSVTCEGGLVGARKPKTEPWGLSFC